MDAHPCNSADSGLGRCESPRRPMAAAGVAMAIMFAGGLWLGIGSGGIGRSAPTSGDAIVPASTAARLAQTTTRIDRPVAKLIGAVSEASSDHIPVSAPDPAAAAPAQAELPARQMRAAILVNEAEGPPAFAPFADYLPTRRSEPLSVAYGGDVTDGPYTVSVTLNKGETFVDALKRAGVRPEDRNAATLAFGKLQNLRALRPGQEFVLTTAEPNQTLFQLAAATHAPDTHLLALDFRPDAKNRITMTRDTKGGFEAKKTEIELTSRIVSVSGRIEGSLFLSAKRAGAPDTIIADLANMFAYDVDFQREIFGGDEFEAIFEMHYDENGRIVSSGDILYGRLNWRGRSREKGYYRFAAAGEPSDYFDRTGQSAKRLLMKTPIDGARLSSGFGTRRHPIHGYTRQHKGVDFAAPTGTPVKAAGDGVVERADWFGTFGNYVRIRHANGYKTAYAHLNGFRRGLRAGQRVRQGEIIAYVGSTGASTGPHLHYEVHHNNQAVNPQNLKIATGVELKGRDLERFKAVRDEIERLRTPRPEDAPLLASDETRKQSL